MSKTDYLSKDTVLPGQEWIVVSFLDGRKLQNCKHDFSMMKFRGAFGTQEEANAHATSLQQMDPFYNIYVAQGFCWIPAEDNAEYAKEGKYAEAELNSLMKKYLTSQAQAKESYERRKNELKMDAISKSLEKKKKGKLAKTEDINDLKSEKKPDMIDKVSCNDGNDDNDEVDDVATDTSILEEALKTKMTKLTQLEQEIATATTLLNMDVAGIANARKINNDIESKMPVK